MQVRAPPATLPILFSQDKLQSKKSAQNAEFLSVVFTQIVDFSHCTFEKEARFEWAHILQGIAFRETKFRNDRQPVPESVGKWAHTSQSQFQQAKAR